MLTTEQKSSLLYKKHIGVADSKTSRDFYEESLKSSFAVVPDQLWMYGDQIPTAASADGIKAIRALSDGEYFDYQKDETTVIHIVQYHEDYKLSKIDNGTDNAFKILDSSGNQMMNIIPFNYSSDLYNYTLKTSGGKKIYFGTGEWIVDTYSGVLRFYGDVPSGIDHSNPPLLSFYQYVGGTGFRQDTFGYDGAILPIQNWLIPKGTYLISTTNTRSGSEVTLEDAVSAQADKVQDNYCAVFGFDGSDNNEGIAYSLNTLVDLVYTSNKENVKGYDDSVNSEVLTLLSRKSMVADSTLPFSIPFITQNFYGEHTLTVANDTISLDGGTAVSVKELTKISDEDGDFIIVAADSGSISSGTYTFSVEETTTNGILLYWDTTEQEYLPFITNEENYYDFGFVLVSANGRIPPSVALNSISLGNSVTDSITSEYYGPRTFTLTVALEDSNGVQSADYVVRNRTGYYLDDILKEIASKYPDLKGTIFFRSGTYRASEDTIDVSYLRDVILLGENVSTTYFDFGITYSTNVEGAFSIRSINLASADFDTVTTTILLNNMVVRGNCTMETENNRTVINNCAIDILKITGTPDSTSFGQNEILNNLMHDVITILDVNTGYTFYSGCNIGTMTLHDVKNDVVRGCFIGTCKNKPTQTCMEGCTVITFDNARYTEIPHMSHFPVYNGTSSSDLRYAKFVEPFSLTMNNGATESGDNTVGLLIDSDYLHIDDSGQLSCNLNADKINVATSSLERDDDYEGDAAAKASPNSTLQEVLEDLFATKADLNPDGKVPLEQLPDSVSYGGLLLVGTWSFEYLDKENGSASDNYYVDGGPYPTYTDAVKNLTVDQTQDNKLQPGWFWIVSSSKKDTDRPAAVQTSAEQTYEDSTGVTKTVDAIEYTAGDWLIWNGSYFEKLDRAYQDVAYMVLPVYTPGVNGTGHYNWSWHDSAEYGWGYGALALGGQTIAESFDMVNQELFKLRVKHPAVCSSVSLIPYKDYKKIQYYSVSNGKISTLLEEHYDITKDDTVRCFRVMTPETDPKWKSGLFVADTSTFQFIVDQNSDSVSIASTRTEDYGDSDTTRVHIQAPFDPFDDEISGSDYWKATYADFGPIEPTEDEPEDWRLSEGEHVFKIACTAVTPDNTFTHDAISCSDPLTITTAEPYCFTDHDDYGAIADIRSINTSDVLQAENEDIISGVRVIHDEFKFIMNFTVEDCVSDEVNLDRYVISLMDRMHGTETHIPEAYITLARGDVEEENVYNVIVKDFPYTFSTDGVLYTEEDFDVKVYDCYGNTNTYSDLYKFTIRFDDTTEDERIVSGNGELPTYDPTIEKACGYPFDSSMSLADEAPNELMKSGRNLDGKLVSEYIWPNAEYVSYQTTTDYHELMETGDVIDGEYYKWATIEKFGEDKEAVVLDEASGFRLSIVVASDREQYWTADEYSLVTSNVIIQAKVVDPTATNAKSVTSWIDCNTPYEGFGEVGTEDMQAAMYAGSSTALSKRITFGRSTYSGNLIVRIGVKSQSNCDFMRVDITDII